MKNQSSKIVDAQASLLSLSLNAFNDLNAVIQLKIGDAIVDQQKVVDWNEIRVEHCDDGNFIYRLECQAWMRQLASYVVEKLGSSPTLRIQAYGSGGDTLLAVDVYSSQTSEYVTLTILFADKCMHLSGPADNQFDIALPGIIDGLSLVGSLLSFTQGNLEPPRALWVCLMDRQDASPHEPKL